MVKPADTKSGRKHNHSLVNVPAQPHRTAVNRDRQYSVSDVYAGPDSFTLPDTEHAHAPSTPRVIELDSSKSDSATELKRLPAHTIVGCPIQLVAEVTGAAECVGVVRFFDQYGLLGAAAIDPDTSVASLPYAFTSGGRREITASYGGCDSSNASRSVGCGIQVYSTDRTIVLDHVTEASRR